MDRLEQIKNEVAQEYGYNDWEDRGNYIIKFAEHDATWEDVARRYATEVASHNLERAAGQAEIEVESRLSGKTIHGSISSEDPQWVARVNRESITSLDIELI